MDKFYRQCVARCCREVGCFVQALGRGVAHATLQARRSRVGRFKSRCGRDTDATRFLAEILDGLVKVVSELKEKSGRGWRRLPQKVEARGRSNNCRQEPQLRHIANASPTAKRRQLDDWSDSPRELTKESAATAPLPALTRYSLASAPQLPIEPWESINMGLGRAGVCLAPCSSRPLTRAFACLELAQSSSSSCLPSSLSQQPLQTTFHRTHSRLRQPIPSHQHSPSQTRQATSAPPYCAIT